MQMTHLLYVYFEMPQANIRKSENQEYFQIKKQRAMTSKEKMVISIMKFMKISLYGYENTSYTEDRLAYQRDIVLCAKWLLQIDESIKIDNIIEDILDSSTEKHILDHYKHGKLGDEQAKGFVDMKKDVQKLTIN